ncbi:MULTISPECIES: hypothetical protein [Streptomyces]|nr:MULTISPECIES: hypothetical protein [Streptomyces]MYT41836.1 hypothetical protein [Streptomyces sp. SID5471]
MHIAHLRGDDPGESLARLTAMDPERIKIPDTDDGRRLRASLRSIRAAQTLTHSHNDLNDT